MVKATHSSKRPPTIQPKVQWATGKVTPKDRVQLPPEAREYAPLIAVCRALLVEIEAARDQYVGIIDQAADTNVGKALRHAVNPQTRRHVPDPIQVAWGKKLESILTVPLWRFVVTWLFGDDDNPQSKNVVKVLAELATLDIAGLDIKAVENARSELPVWQSFYGRSSPARTQLRKHAKSDGWSNLDDPRLMREARVWVRAHHVWKSLKRAVDEEYPGGRSIHLESEWCKTLARIDKAVGRPRKKGTRY